MKTERLDWQLLHQALEQVEPFAFTGQVEEMTGLVLRCRGPQGPVGAVCRVELPPPRPPVTAEIVGFRHQQTLLMPYGDVRGLEPHTRVVLKSSQAIARVGDSLLGRVIDGLGRPLDGKGPLRLAQSYPLHAPPLNPCERRTIDTPLDVGIRAINGLLTLGKGQRIGIFAGSGVGKSTLMGMIARFTRSDVSVIGLIGERGREVKEFIERDLGPEGLARACVVAATSDTPPLVRLRGAYLATAIAEFFRARGYTPSVFSQLPSLLERAGACQGKGSITGIYTVLVEGDDLLEPIADASRAILDGHIVLSRELANRGHYPAVDVLESISRLMPQVAAPEHLKLREKLIQVVAAYRRAEDLININAYVRGSNPEIDYALEKIGPVTAYLRQGMGEGVSLAQAVQELKGLFAS